MVVTLLALLRRVRLLLRGAVVARPPAPSSRPAPAYRPPAIQSLEGRTLYSAGHAGVVIGEQLLGTETQVTGIVLTFSQHLDPTTAQNPKAYGVLRRITTTSTDSGGFFSTGGDTTTTSIDTKHVRIASAVYDDANMTVTLTPVKPFRADKFFRFVRIVGRGPNAIYAPGTGPINGGGDEIVKFASHKGRRLTYKDDAGNKVTLRLSGPGEIRALFRRTGSIDPIVYVVGTNAALSVLTGTVQAGRHGTGVTILQELSGASMVRNNLANNPAFTIQMTQP